jgi:hypothetical protein
LRWPLAFERKPFWIPEVTIHLQNQDVKTILAVIEEQTKVKFLYSTSLIQAERKISLNVQQEKLGMVLEEMLKPHAIWGMKCRVNRLF